MEAYGAYVIKVNKDARVKLPRTFEFSPDEIICINVDKKNAIIRGKEDFHRVSSVDDEELKRQIHASHHPVNVTKNNAITIPPRFKSNISFISQKMVIWGNRYNCLLMTVKDFEEKLRGKKLEEITLSNRKILMLKEKKLSFLPIGKAFSVEAQNCDLSLKFDFKDSLVKKLYCILTSDGLALYGKSEIEKILTSMSNEEKEKLIEVIFTININSEGIIPVSKKILSLFAEKGNVCIIETTFGTFITSPNNKDFHYEYEDLATIFGYKKNA